MWCPPQVVVYTYFPVGDPPPPFVVQDMIDDAYDRTPVVFFNPRSSPEGTDDIPLITQMRTYLWVDGALWQPVSAIAEIPGVISPLPSIFTVSSRAVTVGEIQTLER